MWLLGDIDFSILKLQYTKNTQSRRESENISYRWLCRGRRCRFHSNSSVTYHFHLEFLSFQI